MEEFYIDVPKCFAKKLHDSDVLTLVSTTSQVCCKMKADRLYVRAKDVSAAVAATCKILLTFPNLGTKMNTSDRERVCDWALMHTYLSRMHGAPIATSSALNEADVVHAFRVYAAKHNTRDLASREYGLWSWAWINNRVLDRGTA